MATWQEYQSTMQRPATLLDAARSNDVPELSRLLDEGADIEGRDARGYSPLMLAAYSGHAEACQYLLARGADVNGTDAAGNTILMGAAFKGHLDIVVRLLAAGADRARLNPAGLDARAFASLFGQAAVAELLANHQP